MMRNAGSVGPHGRLSLAIEQAFGWRTRPERMTPVSASPTDIYEDAEALSGLSWGEVSVEMLVQNPACVCGMSGAAFAYYLPGIMTASYVNNRTDLLVIDTITMMLDTSGDPDLWSEVPIEQWSQLRPSEYAVVGQWFDWLHDVDTRGFSHDNQYQRIKSTLVALEAWTQ